MQNTVNGMEYAGFWKRAAAWVIDILVVALPLGAVFFVFAMIYSGGNGPMEYIDNQLALMRWKAIFFRLGLLGGMLYWTLMESSAMQATLGKRVMRLRVVGLNGNRISFGRAAGRALVKGLLSNIFAIGYLIVLFTKKSQALHDIISGCLVLKQSTPKKSDNASPPILEPPAAPSLSATDSHKPTEPPSPCPSNHSSSDSLLARFFAIYRSAIKGKHKTVVSYSLLSIIIMAVVLIIFLVYSSKCVSKDYSIFRQIKSGYERTYWLANNYPHKVSLWRFSAIFGNSKASCLMGMLYETPIINDNTIHYSVKWHTWASWLGNSDSRVRLGNMYLDGKAVVQDETKAFKYFHRAALQFNGRAQYMLGKMYYDGQGITQDYLEAEKWFRKASFKGVADAQFQLGYMNDEGKGIKIDDEFAADCYEAAAEQGHDNAQYNLGLVYEYGEGRPKNIAAAVAMYRKAAEQGHSDAWQRLKELDSNPD